MRTLQNETIDYFPPRPAEVAGAGVQSILC